MHAPFAVLASVLLAAPASAAAGLAGAKSTPAPAAAPAFSEPRDWNAPPPAGTPQDKALWTRLRSAIEDATLAVSDLNHCALRLQGGAYYAKLDALGNEPGPRGEQARALRTRLEAVARDADASVPRPLRTHVCKYTLLHLEQRMDAQGDAKLRAELPQFRAEATGCADELAGIAVRVPPKVKEVEGVLAAADALLGRTAPAPAEPGQGTTPASLLPAAQEKR